jgi:hypothetical protein
MPSAAGLDKDVMVTLLGVFMHFPSECWGHCAATPPTLIPAHQEIEMGDADQLFEFLDRDDSGSLSIVEPLDG